jgi:uncharacterized membrane protein YeaQ/YmgE (transglycosylase-associated protein family)
MGIFSWILLGLIAGALEKFIMPGKDPGGIFVTILIGIAGAIVGGFLGSFIGLGKVESFDLGGIFIATIGAIILLIVYRLLRKRTYSHGNLVGYWDGFSLFMEERRQCDLGN